MFFAVTVLMSILTALMDLVNPQIIQVAVDSILGDESAMDKGVSSVIISIFGSSENIKENLHIVALICIITAIFGAFFRYLYKVFDVKASEKLVKKMRDELSFHIMHLPFEWYRSVKTGDIIQRCTSDVDTVKVFFSEQLTNFIRIIVLMIFSIYFMSDISVKLTLVSAAFIPVIVLYSMFFHKRIGDAFEVADTQEGKLSSVVQENLTGVRVVRAFGKEKFEDDKFKKQNDFYTKMWIRMLKLMSAFWASNDMISGLQILSVVTFGAYLCVANTITAGEYVAFIAYNSMLTWPVRMLGRVITEMSRAGISIGRLSTILNAETEDYDGGSVNVKIDGDIVFDNVSFSYTNNSDDMALENVSFTIKKGTTVGILGGTGSGKSTLMQLLTRLYDIEDGNGQITINGEDIRNIKRSYLRENIGFVLQEPFLFSNTLAGNIAITKDKLYMDKIKKVSKIASLEETIEKFTKGYETYVGERGVTLSGGQKQRTAIAQTLMKDSKVIIFDDSLSAVDAQTDANIRKSLGKETKDATVILIAHRITTIMNADKIIVLKNGQIIEEGNHKSLLEQNGIYKHIYDIQTTGMGNVYEN